MTFAINELFRSWWVLLCIFISFGLYEEGCRTLEKDIAFLQSKIITLQEEISLKAEIQKELARDISSQKDPAWIELSLIKNLGLVPEGYTKIYIVPKEGEEDP